MISSQILTRSPSGGELREREEFFAQLFATSRQRVLGVGE